MKFTPGPPRELFPFRVLPVPRSSVAYLHNPRAARRNRTLVEQRSNAGSSPRTTQRSGRKSSGGTASESGSRLVERILSAVATCRQQGRNALEFLTGCFRANISGEAPPSLQRCTSVGTSFLGSRSLLPSFPSVQGLFAPGRISLEIPSTSLTSSKLNNSPSGTFSSFM